MEKALILASVASMIDQFNLPNIQLLLDMGYEVHVACNFEEGSTCSDEKVDELKDTLNEMGICYYQIDFSRNITNITRNIIAYRQLLNLLKKNDYNFVHCHSPIGGVCGRIAAHKTKTKVIYTAHGFHFFNGAPLKNWLLYYPVEKFLARFTDVLITINNEDYNRARKFKAKRVLYVPGVGIDTKKFSEVKVNRVEKLREIGIAEDSFIILSVGELNKNKNHEVIIKAVAELKSQNIQYLICGQGPLETYLKELSEELDVSNKVHLLSFRKDIAEIYKITDVFAFPSFREGLSVSLMEAMAAGLPVVCSSIRGNSDLIEDGKGGYLVKPDDVKGFTNSIIEIAYNNRVSMGQINKKTIHNYGIERVRSILLKIYNEIVGD